MPESADPAPNPVVERAAGLDRLRPVPGGPADAGVRLSERPHRAKINLRGDGDAFRQAVAEAIGTALPTAANTANNGDDIAVLWLGPDEWLVTAPPGTEGDLVARLTGAVDSHHAAVVDVTDNFTTIRIAGPAARTALAKGCPLDLHPRAFGPGRVAQSVVAQVDVILHQVAGDDGVAGPAFDLIVRRSFAEYLWQILADAGREYGVAVEAA